jgi:hypothetical protein
VSEKKHLYILWTSGDPITADKMVFMYSINAMANDWWDKVTLVIWGGSAKLVSEDEAIQKRVKDAQDAGVYVTACKGCSDQLGVSEQLETIGVDVQYYGVALTNILKGDEALLTI